MTVAIYLYLAQDLDIAVPLIEELQARHVRFKIILNASLESKSPRTLQTLQAMGLQWITEAEPSRWTERRRRVGLTFAPAFLKDVTHFISIVETSVPAHRFARHLVKHCKRKGIKTFTFQHGIENVGLTYSDAEYPIENVSIESDCIFTWVSKDLLNPQVPASTKNKCIRIGCPKKTTPVLSLPQLPDAWNSYSSKISIFENYHWGRFTDQARNKFIEDLDAVASAHPDKLFIVKPHHAGQWLTKRYKGRKLTNPNVMILDPADSKWQPYTAPAVIEHSDLVITTPSTVVLDAALQNKNVWIIDYDQDASAYGNIPKITHRTDWDRALNASHEDKTSLMEFAKAFGNPNASVEAIEYICKQ
jgi:hypothetical protein